MILGLITILLFILILPFLVKEFEYSLELFLFVMGLAAAAVSGTLSWNLFAEIFRNQMLYFITAAVLLSGLLFKWNVDNVRYGMYAVLRKHSLPVVIFLIIVILGLLSSVITAIVASLLLVEIAETLPVSRKQRVRFAIIACYSIGLGAALTPIGEPLATIVVSVLDEDFFFLLRSLGIYIIPGIIASGLFGALLAGETDSKTHKAGFKGQTAIFREKRKPEEYREIFIRAGKIFLFVVALELLGAGFKPLINAYIIHLPDVALYWINMISAVLDNATLAAAEISPRMGQSQITAILMGLLVSGGMLIPGNIPNIVSAGKLHIGSRQWAALGVPFGLLILILYFIVLFFL